MQTVLDDEVNIYTLSKCESLFNTLLQHMKDKSKIFIFMRKQVQVQGAAEQYGAVTEEEQTEQYGAIELLRWRSRLLLRTEQYGALELSQMRSRDYS